MAKDDKQITPAPDAREKITESMKMPSSVNVNINDNSREITSEMIDRLMDGAY